MLPRLPSRVFSVITRVSRRLSIGGLVTWLNVWRKIVVQAAIPLRQHRDRRVVAHAADRLLARPPPSGAGSSPAPRAWSRRRAGGGAAPRPRTGTGSAASVLTMLSICGDALRPLAERLARGQHVLQLVVAVELPLVQIDADRLARPDAALARRCRLRRASPCRSRSRRSAGSSPVTV